MKEKAVVSSCLLGFHTRYDGRSKTYDMDKFRRDYILIPMCPEQLGGLSTPREPAEIRKTKSGRRVIRLYSGEDVTGKFELGANDLLSFCLEHDVRKAIFKSGSPSCGQEGITTALLRANGIEVIIVN